MKAKNTEEAWILAAAIFPTDWEKDEESSRNAGYPIYKSTLEGNHSWVSDLGTALEVNVCDAGVCRTTRINIEPQNMIHLSKREIRCLQSGIIELELKSKTPEDLWELQQLYRKLEENL